MSLDPAPNPVAPSPFDGLIHLISSVSADRGTRTIVVKCGAKMPPYRSHETLGGASGYICRVTCTACLGEAPQ